MPNKAQLKKGKYLKELRKKIEYLSDFLTDADSAYLDLHEAQSEHRKLMGKEWEW